ncbi:MAG: hypothetical protein JXA78_06880 [Anaerolineales bacterium]|nr:hypothetical protein [Anaerolineales bacterium]
MSKIRIAVILAVLFGLLIPVGVLAAGTFYCSALISSGGFGTFKDPWACSNASQLDYIVQDVICEQYGGGHLYRIYSGYYVYYRIEWYGQNECGITYQSRYPGYPPDTGVDLPMPLVVSAAAAAGALLLVVGLALRRKSRAAN